MATCGSRLAVRTKGELACFTRPELKVERFSYPIITPSAARGLLESILWKPAIKWVIERVKVLSPIKFTSIRRNELNSKAPAPKSGLILEGGEYACCHIEDCRIQRNTVALRDVDYIIEAHFEMTGKAGEQDNVVKFEEMFRRRVANGQYYYVPCFGCREFTADISEVTGGEHPVGESRDFGLMLWDILYGEENRAIFFDARMVGGVMEVPGSWELAMGTIMGGGR